MEIETKQLIYEDLVKAQSELKAPKNQYNSFGKYKYRSCEDILEGAKPILAKYGLTLTLSDEPVVIGSRYYIKATAMIVAKDGSNTLVTAYAREADTKRGMDESQVTGTASSYARKYALNGLFLIDDTKDADTNENHEVQTRKAVPKKAPAPKPQPKQASSVPFKAPAKPADVNTGSTTGSIDERQANVMRKTFAEFRGTRSNEEAIADIRKNVGFIPSNELNQEQYELLMNFMLS